MHQKIVTRAWLILLILMMSPMVFAHRIECIFDVNDVEQQLVIHPNNDIFHSYKIDLPGGFRFAGQYLSDLNKFKAYIYHTPKSRHVLLTLQEFNLSTKSCPESFGRHRVYDSSDERELFFQCERKCDK